MYIAFLGIAAFASATGCSSCKQRASASETAGSDVRLTAGAPLQFVPARSAYVTNNGSDSISVLDRDGESVVSVPIDVDPDAHEAPHHLAIDPTRKAVFVALAFPPEVTKTAGAGGGRGRADPHASHGGASDVGRLIRLDLADLSARQSVDVDQNPGDVVLTHDRSRVLVSHFDMKRAMDVAAKGAASPATMFAELVVLEASSMKRLGARAICTAPHGVATTRDDRWAFVACYGSDELAIVDLAGDGLPTSRVPLGATPGVPGVPRYGPYSATLSPDDSLVVVADLEGQDIRVFDRRAKRFLTERTVPLAAKAFMPAFLDDRTVLVPTQAPDGLARVDIGPSAPDGESGAPPAAIPRSGAPPALGGASTGVTKRIAFTKSECALPHVVRVAKDGRAYLVCEGDHASPGSVLEIDKETLATKHRWTVGIYPDGLDFAD